MYAGTCVGGAHSYVCWYMCVWEGAHACVCWSMCVGCTLLCMLVHVYGVHIPVYAGTCVYMDVEVRPQL